MIDNSDNDGNKQLILKMPNMLKYKSKSKSNSKYVSDTEDTYLDKLEREFEGNK